jgi:hypothetical protein
MSASEEDEQSNADDTVVVELAASAGGPKVTKHRNRFPKMRKGEHEYPFLERPCTRDLTIFKCLLISQPFRVGKGLLTNAWASAVKDINGQVDIHSGEKVFDPPLAVKTIRERFKDAMSIIATINNRVAFQSGCDDEASPNELRRVLEDLLEQKRDAELKANRLSRTRPCPRQSLFRSHICRVIGKVIKQAQMPLICGVDRVLHDVGHRAQWFAD